MKARMRKSRPAVVHVEKPLDMRGWKLPCKWQVYARRGSGSGYERVTFMRDTYEEAHVLVGELFGRGWETAEVVEVESLLPSVHSSAIRGGKPHEYR